MDATSHPLVPDAVVAALVPDPQEPPEDIFAVPGLLGASAVSDCVRIYLTADLCSFLDIPEEQILFASAPDDTGRTVWLRRDAPLDVLLRGTLELVSEATDRLPHDLELETSEPTGERWTAVASATLQGCVAAVSFGLVVRSREPSKRGDG
jgi:hypothetical protein